MVGGLWHQYNQLPQCGFCGENRFKNEAINDDIIKQDASIIINCNDPHIDLLTASIIVNCNEMIENGGDAFDTDDLNNNNDIMDLPIDIISQWSELGHDCSLTSIMYLSKLEIIQTVKQAFDEYFASIQNQKQSKKNQKQLSKENATNIITYLDDEKNGIDSFVITNHLQNRKARHHFRMKISKKMSDKIPMKPFENIMKSVKEKLENLDPDVPDDFPLSDYCSAIARLKVILDDFESNTPRVNLYILFVVS